MGAGRGDATRVAVAGGTGATGRQVVEALTAAGHVPVVLARSHGVDLVAGTGLDTALGPRGTETFDEWLAAEGLSRAGGGSA